MSIKIINFDELIDDNLKSHHINDNALTIQHPARCVLIGSSGAGKSNLLLNLLLSKDVKITYNRVYMIVKDLTEDKTKYLQKYFSDIEIKIKKKTGETIKIFTLSDKLEDIPDLDTALDKDMQNLLILDDLITVKNQKIVEDYFIRSRKKNTTCIYLTQSYFKVPKVIRLNSDYFFLFSVPSRREMTNLYLEFGGGLVDDQRTFNQITRESTKNKSFMMIDNKTNVPTMKFRKGFDMGWQLPDAGLDSDDEGSVTKPTLIRIVL
jgi:hypothetical protein